MAQRPFFMAGNNNAFYLEKSAEFKFFTGFSIEQKKKSILSLHDAILKKYPKARILEVSSKSENQLGKKLSAFSLSCTLADGKEYCVENIFQSSKVFRDGGPFRDLKTCSPVEAKKDPRLKNSGPLISFNFAGREWPLEPKTFFYDYLYINMLARNKKLCDELNSYDTFTDIEFNPKVSFNCQARSVAIFVTLMKLKKVKEYLCDRNKFLQIYSNSSMNFTLS